MTDKPTPTCPYCGDEMTATIKRDSGKLFRAWFQCGIQCQAHTPVCAGYSDQDEAEEAAYAYAMRRAEPVINDAFMTTPIGDLPINSEGMRKAVDKIAELEAEVRRLSEPVARVMTLEEVEGWDEPCLLYIEKLGYPYTDPYFRYNIFDDKYLAGRSTGYPYRLTQFRTERYGIKWRCWSSKPTDAQRAAELWEGVVK